MLQHQLLPWYYLNIQAPEVSIVIKLLRCRKLAPEHVQVISEKRRLVGTPRGRGVGRLDLFPFILLRIPPETKIGAHTAHHDVSRVRGRMQRLEQSKLRNYFFQARCSRHMKERHSCHVVKVVETRKIQASIHPSTWNFLVLIPRYVLLIPRYDGASGDIVRA